MKKYKLAKILQFSTFALFICVAFISSIYEMGAYASYVNSLEEQNGEAFGLFAVVAIFAFSVPLSAVFAIVNIACGLALAKKNRPKKGALIWNAVVNIFSCAGLILLAVIYFELYPKGLFSKVFYIVTAAIALFTVVVDFVSLRKEKTTLPADDEPTQEQEPNVTKA